jgi:hypothetical protein
MALDTHSVLAAFALAKEASGATANTMSLLQGIGNGNGGLARLVLNGLRGLISVPLGRIDGPLALEFATTSPHMP